MFFGAGTRRKSSDEAGTFSYVWMGVDCVVTTGVNPGLPGLGAVSQMAEAGTALLKKQHVTSWPREARPCHRPPALLFGPGWAMALTRDDVSPPHGFLTLRAAKTSSAASRWRVDEVSSALFFCLQPVCPSWVSLPQGDLVHPANPPGLFSQSTPDILAEIAFILGAVWAL